MKKKPTEFLTEKEVAALLELPEVTIERWIHQGKIPSKVDHNKTVLSKDEIIEWAKTHDLVIKEKIDRVALSNTQGSLYSAIKTAGIYTDVDGDSVYPVFKNALENLSFLDKSHKKKVLDELINREELASTGLGNGIAIPHTRNRMALDLESAHIPVFFLKEPIFFNTIDNNPVFVLFILFTTSLKEHLKILSKISFILRNEKILEILNNKNSENNLLTEIKNRENA